MSRAIFGRVAPIMRAVHEAATVDEEMAAQWQLNQRQRLTAHRALADILAEKGSLRPDLTVDEPRT